MHKKMMRKNIEFPPAESIFIPRALLLEQKAFLSCLA